MDYKKDIEVAEEEAKFNNDLANNTHNDYDLYRERKGKAQSLRNAITAMKAIADAGTKPERLNDLKEQHKLNPSLRATKQAYINGLEFENTKLKLERDEADKDAEKYQDRLLKETENNIINKAKIKEQQAEIKRLRG